MLGIILLVVGFGFVIFVHELGHFLAAKWVGIRVEQFALGFGQAILSYRKGMGLRLGSSGKAYAAIEKAAADANSQIDHARYGETEYRVNWMPLGGYVKMLGQDDLNPNATSADPRSYNSKSIGARMLVVSAGVIMNIIFGTLGFMVLFQLGLHNPPAIVGFVQPFSPAQSATTLDGQAAPLRVGDRILEINSRPQYDFTKVKLAIALAKGGQPVTMRVQRRDGQVQDLQAVPQQDSNGGLLYIGFTPPPLLRAPDLPNAKAIALYNSLPPEMRPLHPGEVITAVSGQPVKQDDFVRFHELLQASGGRPVALTLRNAAGASREIAIQPHLADISGQAFQILGMQPRALVTSVPPESAAAGKLLPGDIVLAIRFGDTRQAHPTNDQFRKLILAAGKDSAPVDITVQRGATVVEVKQLVPNIRISDGRGLGIGVGMDEDHAVIADVLRDTPASPLAPGSTLKRIAGQEVSSWRDVLRILRQQKPGSVRVETTDASGDDASVDATDLTLTQADLQALGAYRYIAGIQLEAMEEVRRTSSPIEAARWGVEETRDFVLQFYIGLQRMFEGTVSPSNMMGPLGMFHAGAFFAERGLDSVLWFLAMISANLALVNFLPIPIVDGGLFLFLIIEKIQGRPLSPRTQTIAQYVGLALLLSVFVFATYQDILRFLTMR